MRDERNIVSRELGFFVEKIWVLIPIYDARETWAMSPFRDVDKVKGHEPNSWSLKTQSVSLICEANKCGP